MVLSQLADDIYDRFERNKMAAPTIPESNADGDVYATIGQVSQKDDQAKIPDKETLA